MHLGYGRDRTERDEMRRHHEIRAFAREKNNGALRLYPSKDEKPGKPGRLSGAEEMRFDVEEFQKKS